MQAFSHCCLCRTGILIPLQRSQGKRHLELLLLLLLPRSLFWYLDHRTRLCKILRIRWDLWGKEWLSLGALCLSNRGSRGNELNCGARVEGGRAWTLAASTSTLTGSSDRSWTLWHILVTGARATAIKHRNWAGGLELVVGCVLVDEGVWFVDGEASTREGILNKVRQPFQLNYVFNLSQQRNEIQAN